LQECKNVTVTHNRVCDNNTGMVMPTMPCYMMNGQDVRGDGNIRESLGSGNVTMPNEPCN